MTAMTEERKAAMKAGRERALKANGGKKPRKAKAKEPPAWTFNIDDKGELAILDERGAGIELNADDTRRLTLFLDRCIPAESMT